MPGLTPHQLAALQYDKHISLTANAGSGKTFVLSKRYVEIALNEDLSLSNIVAITFTDKAAGELNKKIAKEIEERIETETSPKRSRRLTVMRRQLVSANISTIHSFCINILREFSPEAGIDANFIPIDTNTSEELIDLSIEETLNLLNVDDEFSLKLKYLIRFLGSKSQTAKLLKEIIKERKNVLKLKTNLYSKTENKIAEFFQKEFVEDFKTLLGDGLEDLLKMVTVLNDEVIAAGKTPESAINASAILTQIKNTNDVFEKLTLLNELGQHILTAKGTIKKRGYASKETFENYAGEIAQIEKLFSEFGGFDFSSDYKNNNNELARFGLALTEAFDKALENYTAKKKQKGYLDFEDILLSTQDIIKKDEVRAYLESKYKYIMIDEYQDTNEIQYDIFMPILNDLKSGNLFVVGDEKQSIYMFRDAELEIFDKTKSRISTTNKEKGILNLPHSFRLSPPIAFFTNKLFGELFKNPNPNFNEVSGNNLICAKDKNEKGSVEIILADESAAELNESELAVRRILQFINDNKDNVKFGDIAILCRKRNVFAELENSFIKYNVPYTIVGGKGFYQRQIIYDIFNYCSFLINKNNNAALVGVLRSPFFSLSDQVIYKISLVEGNIFFEKLIRAAETEIKLKPVVDRLQDHLQLAMKTDLTDLLRKMLLESGYWAVVSSKSNSAQEIANLDKLLGLSRNFANLGFKNLYDFVDFLTKAIDSLEDEGQAAVTGDDDSVKIMTIHQAKGLEYKVVFLYKSADASRLDQVKSKSVSIDKNYGILTKVPVNGNYFDKYDTPPVVGLYNYISKRKTIAEAKRLLYVAVTRAINHLVITGSYKASGEDEENNEQIKFSGESFMQFVSDGLGIDFRNGEHILSGELEFMSFSENGYSTEKVKQLLPVKILRDIPLTVMPDADGNKPTDAKKEYKIEDITDTPKEEIISATKVAIYNQCPLKYHLTYDLGYVKLAELYKTLNLSAKNKIDYDTKEYNFHRKEDEDIKLFSDVRGRIIHSILEEEIHSGNLEDVINKKIDVELSYDGSPEVKSELGSSITGILKKFYDSGTYMELKKFTHYKNEYEIYAKENDYFLYGIIDKLIIDKERIIIVDYKTDNVTKEGLKKKADQYFTQLTFYAYLLKKYFSDHANFELRLIFMQLPDEQVVKKIDAKQLEEFGKKINRIALAMRGDSFEKTISHCKECHFSLLNGNCIKSN